MDKRIGLTMALVASMLLGSNVFAEEGPGEHKHKGMDPEQRFAKMDADGNGSVSRDEFMASNKEWSQKRFEKEGGQGSFEDAFAKRAEKIGARFDGMDKDKDGALTKEEFLAGAPKPGDKPRHERKEHEKGPEGEPKGEADAAPPAPGAE